MKIKSDRKSVIVSVINKMQIHTHEELAAALFERGIVATQATLSRDMRELGAVKGSDGCYVIPSAGISTGSGFILKVECSGQICVVHTKPGFASAFATVVDSAAIEGVMGTLAGDDTILIILREGVSESMIQDKINHLV